MIFSYLLRTVFSTGIFIFLITAQVMAQVMSQGVNENKPTELPVVEVEGQVTDSPARMELEFKLEEVPGGTNIIDLDKKTSSQATLSDVLGFEPGIIMQEFFGGNDQPRLNIRGSGIQDNPVSRGVQLLYDGLPLNQADGSFIIGLLDPEHAMLVSVYRGANGMQYGASTLGGAINFIQRNGSNSDAALHLEAGSFDTFNGSISFSGEEKKWDYYFISGHSQSDGFRQHSEGKRSNVMMNAGYKFANNENRTYFNFTDNVFEIPFVLPRDRVLNDPDSILGEGDSSLDSILNILKRDPLRDTRQYRLANKTTLRGIDSDQTMGVYAEKIEDYFKNPLTHTITESTNLGVEYSYKLYLDEEGEDLSGSYQFSLSANQGDMPRELYANNRETGQRLHRFGNLDLKAGNLALGIQAIDSWSESLQWVMSLQWVTNERDIKDKQTPGLLDSDFSYHSVNPKLGLIYHQNDHTRYFTNISRSSEAPTFWQLLLNDALPVHDRQSVSVNPLELQEALTFEIGSEGERENFSWQLNYYYSWIKDELISEIDDDFAINGRTVNYSDDTFHQGIELELNNLLLKGWLYKHDQLKSRLVYNFADYQFDGGRFDGNQIAGIPEHLLQDELNYQIEGKFSIAPNVKWQPQDAYADHVNVMVQDAYTLWGIKLNYQPHQALRFFAVFDNLTNETYQTSYVIHGSAVDDNGSLVPTFIPGAGFNMSVGMVLKW